MLFWEWMIDGKWGGIETMTRNIQLLGNDFEGFWKTPNENIYYIKKLKLFIASKIATVFHLIVKQK